MNDMHADPEQPEPTSAASILAAAERLAAEIRRSAEADAEAIRARAGNDSDAARAATAERVRRLSALADGMLERLGEMRGELDSLCASLAGSGDGVREPPAAGVAEPPAAGVAERPAAGVAERPAAGVAEPPAAGVPEPPVAAAPDVGAPEPAAAGVDDAGARLIALNLALSNTPRDEAARQLRDQVPDPERLVDEVYASVDR